MDLSRAKTILILCFLLLNLFLASQLWQVSRYLPAGGALSATEVEQAQLALASAGYELSALLPRQVPSMALLHVTRQSLAVTDWQRRVFGTSETSKAVQDGKTVFLLENERLEITPYGQLKFSLLDYRRGTGADSRQSVERFLRERGFWLEGLKFDLSFPGEPGTIHYRFVQIFQKLPLFAGYVEVRVTEGKIREVTLRRLQPLEFSGREVRVISAAEALEVFISKDLFLPDKRILDISLGYFSREYNASRWEIAPAWRIAAAGGHFFYVNAFTGELEYQER
jgi:hypothetical protein